ncbi:MAG: translation initiation factor IF-3 [Chthoniobacteraceae bacterium]
MRWNDEAEHAPRSKGGCSKEQHPIQQTQQIRVNGRIRAREVRVIMASNNEQLGIMKLSDAIRQAQSVGLDLVEVAPNANPPVCRIVDFGKYRYALAKQEKERKHTTSKVKEVKFRVNISDHDYFTKVRHAEEFLDKGNKVKVLLQFRGREMAHKELGMAVMQRVKNDLNTMSQVEMEPKQMGKSITMTLAPLPANKRKRKFEPPSDEYIEDEEGEEHEEGEEGEE